LGWSSSPSPAPSQQEASFTLDTNLFLSLVSSSSSPRERQRLNRLNQPHAGSWVTALPSSIDGPEAIIRPTAFRIACRLRLGVPVFSVDGAPCPSCMHTTLDRYGDHAICCTKTGDLIVRHNRIRDLVDKIAQEGQLSPVLEKKGNPRRIGGPGRLPFPSGVKARACVWALRCPALCPRKLR